MALRLPTDRCIMCGCERWKHKPFPNTRSNGSCTRCGPEKCKVFRRGRADLGTKRKRQEAA